MKTLKYFLLGLLVLVSVTSIFNTPGANLFNSFYNLSIQTDQKSLIEWSRVFLQYPPGTYLTLNVLLYQFKVDPSIGLFDRQSVWLAAKFLLYFFYLLTYVSLLYLKKVNGKMIKLSFLHLSIAYFGCISILLSSVGLIFFDILSAPFLVLSITFLMQRKLLLAAIFYIASLFFCWSLFILAPIYVFVFLRDKQSFLGKTIVSGVFLVTPSLIILTIIASKYHNAYFFGNSAFLNPGGFSKLLSLPFEHVFKKGRMDELGWLAAALSLAAVVIGLGALFQGIIFDNLKSKKTLSSLSRRMFNALPYLIVPIALYLSLFWTNSINYLLLGMFLIIYFFFVIRFKHLQAIPQNITQGCFVFYLIAFLFLQDLSIGSSLVLVLVTLLLYIFNTSKFNFYLLFLVNLLTFINIFSNFGITGLISVRGEYFVFFKSVFATYFTLFIIWYLKLFFKSRSFDYKEVHHLKWWVIILMVLLNLSWIPADGSPDHVSWTQYAVASIEEPNPFAAQTLVDQRYPPLSTAILSIFANSWKILVGESNDYAIATKLSVITFYFFVVALLAKFSKDFSGKKELSISDKLFIILTTFAITTQTQGFADLNIHLIPFLFTSIYFLFKRRYLLSGLLMGITISIKWQPIILLPLFGATLFDFRQISQSIKNSFLFGLGLLPIPISVWVLVLVNPGGKEAFERATDYLLHGAPMLSGQALNLNWIATYALRIIDPVYYGSVQSFDYLNRQIPTDHAPWVFQGILFLIVWALIFLKYWLKEKKDIVSFLAASVMIFLSHHQLNKSAYEKHIFYVVIIMLFLYLIRPTQGNRLLLFLFDIMTVMNLIFFYGFTGTESVSRHFFYFDITILFSLFYLIIYLRVMWDYFRGGLFFVRNDNKA